ncbi:GNAT family N-acetyltransferase [Devosia algicola]|uniref:hypothetical protein n=1 Tax=Devosia algicola TaxID=3026418 RepID=UPI002E233147
MTSLEDVQTLEAAFVKAWPAVEELRDGAHRAAIQVQADNDPALALYQTLGFAEPYDYHYRRGVI